MQANLIGTNIQDTNGRQYRIEKKIGEGAQGIVYESSDGFIIKKNYTNKENRDDLIKRYKWIMNQRIPKEARMVTPIAILEEPHAGYVMKKVKGHEPLLNYITPSQKVPFGEWYNLLTGGLKKRLEIGILLSKCFRNLHIHGLCYCDLSPNNVLVARKLKSIALIDPDNLTSTGTFKPTILGTPRYIAPELFKSAKQPNSISDTYSFAVLLFELLRLGHPLLGDDILDDSPEVEEDALIGNVVYVDHPDDLSNKNTKLLPGKYVLTEELKTLFKRTFVDGLHDYMKRPTLNEFRSACQRAEDLIIECKNSDCSATFYHLQENESVCPWCQTKYEKPLRLTCKENINVKGLQSLEGKLQIPEKELGSIVLQDGFNVICKRHFEPATTLDGDEKIAVLEVMSNKEIKIHMIQEVPITILNKKTRKRTLLNTNQKTMIDINNEVILYNFNSLKDVDDIFGSTSVLHYGVVTS
jgi:DNA-binding helix-hairpin-helix protein with protein kinase domain